MGASTQASPPGLQLLHGAVAELDRDPPGVDEVELLLLVVEVVVGGVAGRQDDRVDAEGGHPQRRADLAEAGPLPEVVEVGGGPAVAALDSLEGLAHIAGAAGGHVAGGRRGRDHAGALAFLDADRRVLVGQQSQVAVEPGVEAVAERHRGVQPLGQVAAEDDRQPGDHRDQLVGVADRVGDDQHRQREDDPEERLEPALVLGAAARSRPGSGRLVSSEMPNGGHSSVCRYTQAEVRTK